MLQKRFSKQYLQVEFIHFTIDRFLSIIKAQNIQRQGSLGQNQDEINKKEKQRRDDEDKLVDLALKWNYFDGVLPILQARQNDMAKKTYHFIKV